MMASKACRLGMRGRPPLACEGASGINGSTCSHNRSLTFQGWVRGMLCSSTRFCFHCITGFRISSKSHQRQGKHPLFYAGLFLIILVAFLTAYTLIPPAIQKWHDESVYGYPRTYQNDANVG